MVTELRLRVEKHKYDMEGITDPGVPASLFKLWLRELADPVVTADLYDEAVKHAEDADKCIELLTRLPEINRNVILFTIRFLQVRIDRLPLPPLPARADVSDAPENRRPGQRAAHENVDQQPVDGLCAQLFAVSFG